MTQAAENQQERSNHWRIELGATATHQLLCRIRDGHRLPVRAIIGHCVEGIDDEDDSRPDRDVLSREAIRIAGSVEVFVMVADQRQDITKATCLGERPVA